MQSLVTLQVTTLRGDAVESFLFTHSRRIFFPVSTKLVRFGWFEALKDGTIMSSFDWGPLIIAKMYHALDECSRMTNRTGQFSWTVLQYWYYEYLRTPTPHLKNPSQDIYPRILRWAPNRLRANVGDVAHKRSPYRSHVEIQTQSSVAWTTFAESPFILEHPDCIRSWQHSMYRDVFTDGEVETSTEIWRMLQKQVFA